MLTENKNLQAVPSKLKAISTRTFCPKRNRVELITRLADPEWIECYVIAQ